MALLTVFKFFSLKGVSVADMPATTEALIEAYSPLVLVIDGSRDYVINSNDPSESMKLTNQLLYWAYQHKLHIINIVHSIRMEGGRSKTKGTFGSELDNKAETIVSLQRQGSTAKVKCDFSRESTGFESFKITLNENGVPVKV